MKIFYTCDDVEELVASGVNQIELGPGVAITDLAREMAEDYGIKLVLHNCQDGIEEGTPSPAVIPVLGNKPSGCQHGYSPPAEPTNRANRDESDGMVGRLVHIVSRIADQGG